VWWVAAQTERTTGLPLWLSPETVREVWTDPEYLLNGFRYSLPLLLILLCHELGHYLLCRRYRLPSSPPFFLPVPFALGTLGAFIRIRRPIRDKRQLFDVGAWGPPAGFLALLPFLVYGIGHSRPAPLLATDADSATAWLLVPGRSLLVQALSYLFHGPLDENMVLNLHPFALAAWVGLLATALNLMPLGQLDGGHILYAALGRWHRRVALPLWLGLALCGFLWMGWFLWCAVILAIGLRHPPVDNENEPLDSRRLALAWLNALILALAFMPVPLTLVPVSG
jgi:membrane-associated protease RseP (regulator of RpoE activity)